jgi:Trk-type K+ transport system membrane component
MKDLKLLVRWGKQKSKRTVFVRESWNTKLASWISVVVPSLLFMCVAIVVYEFGFKPFWTNHAQINLWLRVLFIVVAILTGFRLLLELAIPKKRRVRFLGIFVWLFVLFITFYLLPEKTTIAYPESNRFLLYKLVIYIAVVLGFISEVAYPIQFLYSKAVSPGLVFIGSFTLLIFLGAALLKLPNASTSYTSNINALFTSASAVCVTGLIVVDTATHFTPFGQLILLLLIQTGGLGFMTFAGLLAYALAGNASFKAQLAFTDIMSRRKLGNIMHFIYQVVLLTLFFEGVGAMCIYFSLDDALFTRRIDKLFFSIFHSVSAFCNAGFSTYSNGLYEPAIRFNYPLQCFIAILVILGGMGFPIVFNLYRWLHIKAANVFRFSTRQVKRDYMLNVIMLNSRLALTVSGLLLCIGFTAYMLFEQNATLAQHPTLIGKIVTSFFGSVTPRTAGFNTVDLTAMSLPMLMIYLLLMWVGASPGSTGGGIKTTTAGVAVLNLISILRGKDRTEFFRSEISFQSIRRAFAIIVLSLLFIGVTISALAYADGDKGTIKIAFEAFSAFSTVGLSLGITAQLSGFSKLVLVLAMFIGRVGAITLLVILIRQSKQLYYRYPKEDIAF